jgi:hypothetical protein
MSFAKGAFATVNRDDDRLHRATQVVLKLWCHELPSSDVDQSDCGANVLDALAELNGSLADPPIGGPEFVVQVDTNDPIANAEDSSVLSQKGCRCSFASFRWPDYEDNHTKTVLESFTALLW